MGISTLLSVREFESPQWDRPAEDASPARTFAAAAGRVDPAERSPGSDPGAGGGGWRTVDRI